MNKPVDYTTLGHLSLLCVCVVFVFFLSLLSGYGCCFCGGMRVVKTLISDWKDLFDANDVLRNARLMILPCYGDDDQ